MAASVMTPEVVTGIQAALRAGLGVERASDYVGINVRTVKGWLARGRAAITASIDNDAPIPAEDQLYATFASEVDTSRAHAIARNITTVQTASQNGKPVLDRNGAVQFDRDGNVVREPGDWRAAAWWLEHVHPDEFGRTSRVELTGANGGPVEMESVVVGQIDHRVALDVGADPNRLAAIAQALAHTGLLGIEAAIEVNGGPVEVTADEPDPI